MLLKTLPCVLFSLLFSVRLLFFRSESWLCRLLALSFFSYKLFFQVSIHEVGVGQGQGPVHAQLCPTLCYPIDCSAPGSSVHEIVQPRILQWLLFPTPRNLPNPRIERVSLASPALAGRFFIIGTTSIRHCYFNYSLFFRHLFNPSSYFLCFVCVSLSHVINFAFLLYSIVRSFQ